MNPQGLEDLSAWQEARSLAAMLERLLKKSPLNRDYGLCDRIWKSSLSVMFNITKGFESSNTKEKRSFLGHAKRSLGEIISQLYHIFDQHYIDKEQFEGLHGQAALVGEEIVSLIAELKQKGKRDGGGRGPMVR